ncbi:MAG: O-succinylhomoserine sulfhydrylase [Gammaproteobacteria bacterium]|nr:O-succinylhomoserine sulfhydrylase [Gammaproteobacteria bacterium]NIR83083.1 O-succinylhomoserine sulfhydrylase [Gammaproteobacteria bacterium]NIR90745.1 O-succinylhomoserine sulfhydrylase [Gammaproteobacteria bacterium]NIU04236.1 O-succinylhomoserine sulfhydrylase [Gammaproteobacteria bacterium]NIV51528.1 O-succinylhomoserine sulfhydrylase [Gammaproteobacteria bacterium]
MADDESGVWGFETQSVRAGQVRTPENEHNDPIFATSSFVFRNARQAAARFSDEEPGNVYARFTNPTVRTFEERLAALEGGGHAVATASGMSAILTTCLALLRSGDHVVASHSLFGATISLFTNILARYGVETTFVPLTDVEAWGRAVRPETRLLFLETPSNPLMEVADIAALAEVARAHRCLLLVDNCMCTPALLQPLKLGADIVVHSGTKYLDGQGRCVGGAVVVRDEFIRAEIFSVLRTAGPSMSPFNAWILLKGLETLRLRMEAHSARALELARWLAGHPVVTRVHYPGLASHPQHELAASYQRAFGGVVAFEVYGAREAAWSVIDATRFISITANFGDAKSTITHPATTTHARVAPEQRAEAGVSENLLRISVGLEDMEDIKRDLARGLDALVPRAAGAPTTAVET